MIDQPSEAPERRLLSLARPGQTLRFYWTRVPDGRFRMSLEGLGADPEAGRALGGRIGAFLSLMEQDGVEFYERPGSGDEAPEEEGDSVWLDIVPEGCDFAVTGNGVIGFGSADTGQDRIRLPALEPFDSPEISDYFLDLVADMQTVKEVCVCLTRQQLSPQREQLLNQNLQLPFAEALAVAGGSHESDDLQRFLASWLVRRRGWSLKVLTRVDYTMDRPDLALELLGREWFGSECRVQPAKPEGEDDPLDFSSWFPDGWKFPRIFPTAYATDRLAVESRVNPRLPGLPSAGVVIGEASGRSVRMPDTSRDQHTYILGATGTGKSTLLKRMIRHDLAGDEGLVLLDPHGDLFEEVLDALPGHRRENALILNPRGKGRVPGFNILADAGAGRERQQRIEFLIGELLYLFRELWADSPEAFGPMFELYFRNTFLLLACQPNTHSVADFDRVLVEKKFRDSLISTCDNVQVVRFWKETAAKAGGEASLANIAPYISCKLSPLIQSYFVGDMLGHAKNTLDLDDRLNRGGVVLVNLDKGVLGMQASRLLGSLITTELFSVGLRRSRVPRASRRTVNVFIDEFQNFISPTVGSMFAEARKFGLRLHVANQTLGQLTRSRDNLTHNVLGNVGNQIFFRVGVQDTENLEPFFQPFTRGQMQELPNFQAFVRLMSDKGPLRPFVLRTLDDV